MSEDSPHKSGIKTFLKHVICYALRRKTRPTNRGLRRSSSSTLDRRSLSEDSPHKSGIKTTDANVSITSSESEDSPHKSGIKTSKCCPACTLSCRKTRPTNRGLRQFCSVITQRSVSEDSPHKSGIKTTYFGINTK